MSDYKNIHEIAWRILENGDLRREELPDPIRYGIVSAFIHDPSADNKKRHHDLLQRIIKLGYHPKEIKGLWDGVWEISAFVPHISLEEIVKVALEFDQKAIIYKMNTVLN